MKNLYRVFSVLEVDDSSLYILEESRPSEKEIAHEQQVTHLLRNEPDPTLNDRMEAELDAVAGAGTSGFWEISMFNPLSSPTYLPSRLNPESEYFYHDTSTYPSPTSSSTSVSSNANPLGAGHRSPASLRGKRKPCTKSDLQSARGKVRAILEHETTCSVPDRQQPFAYQRRS
ncbi:hypothetical protein K493DRAFT_335971 [Basidiobolus meristosporus CBS 931.73]|uniref:Uncharacterized protein n=1 Tax=Basidiobolus meristosporus CBS 931.73 TaxID=1314790 RepID=A0A1Y1YLL5_9FUNG|nr:hypothetical protein K493DRAFT_335971 [Basidiobolus meristosporus CBS 931.73]|eukprot:ORX98888.1 hypothetical protein K493DRAFT_335971 [Basidiobolus meristosporus CBS 931.73]